MRFDPALGFRGEAVNLVVCGRAPSGPETTFYAQTNVSVSLTLSTDIDFRPAGFNSRSGIAVQDCNGVVETANCSRMPGCRGEDRCRSHLRVYGTMPMISGANATPARIATRPMLGLFALARIVAASPPDNVRVREFVHLTPFAQCDNASVCPLLREKNGMGPPGSVAKP